MKNILALLFFGIILLGTACEKDETPEDEKELVGTVDCTTVTFAGTIFPLVQANCSNSYCHGAGSATFEMTNYAQVKAKADNGKINSRVLVIQDMPQGGSLTSEELGQIQCWLDAGAPDN